MEGRWSAVSTLAFIATLFIVWYVAGLVSIAILNRFERDDQLVPTEAFAYGLLGFILVLAVCVEAFDKLRDRYNSPINRSKFMNAIFGIKVDK